MWIYISKTECVVTIKVQRSKRLQYISDYSFKNEKLQKSNSKLIYSRKRRKTEVVTNKNFQQKA